MHFASKFDSSILFDTGSGNKKRLLDISSLAKDLGEVKCSALLSLHALTGCDTTSALKGIGKQKPIKILEKNREFNVVLAKLGETWSMDQSDCLSLEHFMCCVYGFPRFTRIDKLRLHLFRRKFDNNDKINPGKTIDFGNMPPCFSSLYQHILRANFQTVIWKSAIQNFPELEDALLHGWETEDNILQPVWTDKDVLPKALIDILEVQNDSGLEFDDVIEEEKSEDSDPEFIL